MFSMEQNILINIKKFKGHLFLFYIYYSANYAAALQVFLFLCVRCQIYWHKVVPNCVTFPALVWTNTYSPQITLATDKRNNSIQV